jgi:hypothetical protein
MAHPLLLSLAYGSCFILLLGLLLKTYKQRREAQKNFDILSKKIK